MCNFFIWYLVILPKSKNDPFLSMIYVNLIIPEHREFFLKMAGHFSADDIEHWQFSRIRLIIS
jgi:hypothetical protein